jgi:hypothetical protein
VSRGWELQQSNGVVQSVVFLLVSTACINGASKLRSVGHGSLRLCLLLSALLLVAGIEPNPGPTTCAELAVLINNLTAMVNAGFNQCNVKLDVLVADVNNLKSDVNDLKTKQTTLESCHQIPVGGP